MRVILSFLVVTALLISASSPCFARWPALLVSKEEAKELGLQVRTTAIGPNRVSVELEFEASGNFTGFNSEGQLTNGSRVELWIGQPDTPRVTAALREDRSKAGCVVVGFVADVDQLAECDLRVVVPRSDGGAKGITYVLRVKDFVEPKKEH